ncbi:MAG: hypothetical protein KBS91_02665, partial [Firmicutes bacterium]|nr:hypothetical protein [Candidatus Caballimonas caccae]
KLVLSFQKRSFNMKKFLCLILTVALLVTMLLFTTMSASAAENITAEDINIEDSVIEGSVEYGNMTVNGTLCVKKDAELTVDRLHVGTLLLEPGAKIKANEISIRSNFSCIPSGVTIEAENSIHFWATDAVFIESGAVVKTNKIKRAGNTGNISSLKLTVCAGATLIISEFSNIYLDIYGTLKSAEDMDNRLTGNIQVFDGALLDLTFTKNNLATMSARFLNSSANGNRVYYHKNHVFNNGCVNCDEGSGSIYVGAFLSSGSIIIICVVGGVALITAGVFMGLYFKKKKSIPVGGTENENKE